MSLAFFPFVLSLSKDERKKDEVPQRPDIREVKMFWVYILRCADGSYYTGHTDDLERRMGQYHAGECTGYTAARLPARAGRSLISGEANQRVEPQQERGHDAWRLGGSISFGPK